MIYFASNAISGSMMLALQHTSHHRTCAQKACRQRHKQTFRTNKMHDAANALSRRDGTGPQQKPVGFGDEAVADHLVHDEVRLFEVVPAKRQ